MTKEQIAFELKQYITEKFLYNRPEIHLTNDTLLFEEVAIDSLQLFQLLAFMEERLHWKMALEDLVMENFESITAIVKLMNSSRQ